MIRYRHAEEGCTSELARLGANDAWTQPSGQPINVHNMNVDCPDCGRAVPLRPSDIAALPEEPAAVPVLEEPVLMTEELDHGEGDLQVVPPTRAELDAALQALPGAYTDAEYVVNGMRLHFGELFTAEDEAAVRERVKPLEGQ